MKEFIKYENELNSIANDTDKETALQIVNAFYEIKGNWKIDRL